MIEANRRGFDNCLMRDMLGNIAELANANVFMVKNGVAHTPAVNGVFLDGVTRRRVIGLLRGAGVSVVETALTYADFLEADEIFSTGNYSKVAPVTRIDDRTLPRADRFFAGRERRIGVSPMSAPGPAPFTFTHEARNMRELTPAV